jgi:hypothetical protein
VITGEFSRVNPSPPVRSRIDHLLAPLVPDEAERRRSVATLWAALHGLASLASSRKLAVVNDDPREMGRLLVRRFLGGMSG